MFFYTNHYNMKKDRIQIDGVWYVKEEPTQNKIEIEDHQLTQCQTLIYETDDYCWKAFRIYKDDWVTFYDEVGIEFLDKEGDREDWKEEYWDNNNWFRGVYENNEDSLKEARESMDENGIAHFQAFVGKLIEKGWL
jgi:hypothetical protein